MTGQSDPPLTEDGHAPEIFVDGYASNMVCAGGTVKFTFFSMAHNVITGQPERRIVLRLAASVDAVAGIHTAIGRLMATLPPIPEEPST